VNGNPVPCSLCGEQAASDPHGSWWSTQCDRCGPYNITPEAHEELVRLDTGRRSLVAAWCKELHLKRASIPLIVSSTIEQRTDEESASRIIDILELYTPRLVGERLDRILVNLGRMSEKPGEKLALDQRHCAVCFSESPKQALFFLGALHKQGWIEEAARLPTETRVTVDGWNRIAELHRAGPLSRQVFVAMSFHPSLEIVWKSGLEAGVGDADLTPLRVDKKEHNEKICDLITNEIRKSCLVVADVTLQRQGVYFEAGFAMGLDIPVIWTCRKNEMKKCHFDTRQYNHIDWVSPADLRERLRRRIEATVPHVLKKQ
jgi:hypothetical protein